MLKGKETHPIHLSGNRPVVNVIIQKGMRWRVIICIITKSLMQPVYEKQFLVLGTKRYKNLIVASTFGSFITLVPQGPV